MPCTSSRALPGAGAYSQDADSRFSVQGVESFCLLGPVWLLLSATRLPEIPANLISPKFPKFEKPRNLKP